ncbi:MAG: AmmeMemoRadiSam system protein A [Clostridia bacterium]|jgi:AmmeMemoRadiSam system protein A|nr:AmmeMemoRadiSam system protein A [Clostridia bacterium]
MLEFIGFLPHPPLIIPEVGGDEAGMIAATQKAMTSLAAEIKTVNPDVLVLITPHGPVFSDAVTITAAETLRGDMAQFGAPQIKLEFSLDLEAAGRVRDFSKDTPVPVALLDKPTRSRFNCSDRLDHGLFVPLYFVSRAGWQGKILPVNMAFLPYEELYDFGGILRAALDDLGRRWVLLASGDMSHCLLPGAPAPYSPKGAEFDHIIRQAVASGDVPKILSLEKDFIEEAAECGLRPLVMALGALEGYEIAASELSYEGPFGVGYFTARLQPGKIDPSRAFSREFYRRRQEKMEKRRTAESLPVRLARESIAYFLTKGQILDLPAEYVDLQTGGAGVFVSLKKQGNLRGCIGTVEATQKNLGLEIIHNAVSAACRDPRFEPLQLEELQEAEISVDVLEAPEDITGIAELDPRIYGVIVKKGSRQGLLLPNLEGIHDAAEQVEIAKQKAGLRREDNVTLSRFKVTRYT